MLCPPSDRSVQKLSLSLRFGTMTMKKVLIAALIAGFSL
ncbi:arginine ABC transporter substrate-binding protein, partial [Salmonella enterica subsp. enterica serovar Typhimurium]|nr:arginine ABC transporter substrate-binding protein [Salmonella enterica]ECY5113956.1 arginine ABC transporter substrate-binding protein [Salmonella enterica subsp. enterica serovar Typhimurium]